MIDYLELGPVLDPTGWSTIEFNDEGKIIYPDEEGT